MSVLDENIEKLISTGFVYHQENKLDEAESIYLEALKLDEKNSEIYNLLGVLKLQQNDVISAINWIEKAVEIEPNAYFYETLFQAYIRASLYKQIIKREKEVLEKFPDNFCSDNLFEFKNCFESLYKGAFFNAPWNKLYRKDKIKTLFAFCALDLSTR